VSRISQALRVAFIAIVGGTSILARQSVDPGRTNRPPGNTGAAFVDATGSAGIKFVHASGATPAKHMVETFGSGVAWIDYDGDGWPDLFFVNGAPGSANVLYRNQRDGTFRDVTAQAGVAGTGEGTSYKTGVAVGDIDNDGDLDLYVTALGPNTLFRNNGNGTFTDVTAAAGVAGPANEWSTSTGFFDYDRDGDLDLYVANYLDYHFDRAPYCGYQREGYRMYCSPTQFDGVADRLYQNNGSGTFTDVSKAAGIANPAGKGLGVTFCDVDGDALTDIYVANDLVRNFLYKNLGNGTFRDIAYGAGVGFDANGKPQAGMGTDCGDVNGDGRPDLFVTNFSDELNTLYMNLGGGLFEDATEARGLGSGFIPLGFGTKFFDSDNDGDLDLYVTNGHVIDNVELYRPGTTYAQRDLFYENTAGRFFDVTATSGAALQQVRVGRGLAVADYDHDGDIDVVITSVGRPAVLLQNQRSSHGHWLEIRAKGKTSNRFGLGARVRVETTSGVQVREINNVSSYESANDVTLHVGLGADTTARQVEVTWPSGRVQTLANVAGDRILTIEEP